MSLELPASLDQQASAPQNPHWEGSQKGSPQLIRGPPDLAGTDTHTPTVSWKATHSLFLQPPPYQSDQSVHACPIEPPFSFSRIRPVFLLCSLHIFVIYWSADRLLLTSAAVLRGVWNCPSLDAESLWFCSRNPSVPEVGLLLETDLSETFSQSMVCASLSPLLPQSPAPAPLPDASF